MVTLCTGCNASEPEILATEHSALYIHISEKLDGSLCSNERKALVTQFIGNPDRGEENRAIGPFAFHRVAKR